MADSEQVFVSAVVEAMRLGAVGREASRQVDEARRSIVRARYDPTIRLTPGTYRVVPEVPSRSYRRWCEGGALDRQAALCYNRVYMGRASVRTQNGPGITHKVCYKCKAEKPVSDFVALVGYRAFCKSCRKPGPRPRPRFTEVQGPCRRAYRVAYSNRRRNSRTLVWTITYPQFERMWLNPCSYCGGKSTGVDRVDNEFGYTPENSVGSCATCNRAKHVLSREVFEEWALKLAGAILKRRRATGRRK